MNGRTKHSERIQEVERIFEEYGFANADVLEGWDGEDLGDLAAVLTEEEYQTLLDELEEGDESRP